MEQPYEEFITNGKFLIGEELVDVKMLQREYAELGSDKDFLNFLQGLYSRRFNGQIPPSLVDKSKSRQQYNRLISSIVIGDSTGGIVRQREILEDMRKSVNRSLFAFTELEKAKEVLTKHIDDLDTLVDVDLEILIDRRLKALTLAYSTIQRKVAEYVNERLPDTIPEKEGNVKTEEREPYRGGGSKLTEASRAMREAGRKKLQFKKGEKSLTPRQLVQEAKEKVRVKLGDTPRRLTQQQIKDMLDDLKSAQPEILEEAKEDIRKEIESQLKIEKKRLSEIESRLKTVDKYKPLIRESSSLVGEYTGDKEIFEEQVVLGNKVKLAAQGLREIEGIMRQLNKENEQSLEEWIEGAEKSVTIDLDKFGKLGAGIGDTTPKEVRLVGELVERVNTRFNSLQEQINIVKNKLKTRK
jgi:vacuolar-type H+-ATPase subunit H